MSKCTLPVYDSRTEEVIRKIHEGIRPCINRIYTNSNGFKWCINARGYYHLYRIEPCRADGKIYYVIQHYRLKPDGNLTDAGHSLYSTYEKAKEAFEQLQ